MSLEGTCWANHPRSLGIQHSSEATSFPQVVDAPTAAAVPKGLDPLGQERETRLPAAPGHANRESTRAESLSTDSLDPEAPLPSSTDRHQVLSRSRDWVDWDLTVGEHQGSGRSDLANMSPPLICSTPNGEYAAGAIAQRREFLVSPGLSPVYGVPENPAGFFQCVEESLKTQEELMSKLIEHISPGVASTAVSPISGEPVAREPSPEAVAGAGNSQADAPVFPLPAEDSFHGFGEDSSARGGSTPKLEMLQLMRRQNRQIRDYVARFRSRGYRPSLEPCGIRMPDTPLGRSPLTVDETVYPGRSNEGIPNRGMHTRSRGPVAEVPHVQLRTLEYKEYPHRQTD